MKIRVEYLKPKYIEALHYAIDSVAKEKKYFTMSKAPSLSEVKDLTGKLTESNYPMYIARVNSEVIGWIDISVDVTPSRKHVGVIGMGVVSKYRRQGIASRLLRRAVKHGFEKTELLRIQLEVYTDNVPAIQLYTKHGFRYEGVKRKAIRMKRKYKDAIIMAIVH